jgi:hypothetical protein
MRIYIIEKSRLTLERQNKGITKKYACKLACAQLVSASGGGAEFPYSAVEETCGAPATLRQNIVVV